MVQKKFIKNILFSCAIILISIFILNFPATRKNIITQSSFESIENNTIYDHLGDDNSQNIQAEYDGYSSLTYSPYSKGQEDLNIVINFVNYPEDTTNHFTLSEINQIITTFKSDLKIYFSRMSQDYLTINIDYVCTTAANSYGYYLGLSSASISMESNIFLQGVNDGLDYDGSQKAFVFDTYNFRVNAFAGSAGSWNTFLWPHAYPGQGIILMMEEKEAQPMASSTMCHEMMHLFGVGDLYAYTGASQNFGAQGLDMMCSSTKNMSVNAHYRNQVGWIEESKYDDAKVTPIEEITDSNGFYNLTLNASTTSNYGSTIAYKFGENKENGEYFMVEYRAKNYESTFDPAIHRSGVVIYRVNPGVSGNSNGSNGEIELMYMGNTDYDITQYDYSNSCLLRAGDSYGSQGQTNSKSLVYSSGAGKSNLFNGKNSDIIVKVNSISGGSANITIIFTPGVVALDMSQVQWNYTAPFNYSGNEYEVEVINLPQGVVAIYYGVISAKNANTYKTIVEFIYDEELYVLENLTIQTTLDWVILPAEITIKIHDKSSQYGEAMQSLTYAISSGQLYKNDKLEITLVKQEGNNAGTYSISGQNGNANYLVHFVEGVYTIIPRQIDVAVKNQSFDLYNFTNIDTKMYIVLGSSDTVLDNDILNIEVFAEGIDLFNPEVGTYSLSAKVDNNNYKLNVIKGLLTISGGVDLSNVKWDYTTSFNYNSLLRVVRLINIPDFINVIYENASSKEVGVYSASATLNYDTSKYNIINDNFPKSLTWEILPAKVTISIDNKMSTYGYAIEEMTYNIVSGTIYGTDNLNLQLNKEYGNDAGVYDITATIKNGNYELIYNTAKYTITPRVIDVKVENQSYNLYNFVDINKKLYTILPTGDTVLAGDTVNISVFAEGLNLSNLEGTYVLKAEINNNKNYILNVIQGVLTISGRVDLSNVKWDYTTSFYYNGASQSVKLINIPDFIDVIYENASSKDVGVYSASATLNYDTSKYNIINDNFSKNLTWEILPAKVIISIDNKISTYGYAIEELTYNIVSGTVYGMDNLNLQLNKEHGNDVGVYDITATIKNENYELIYNTAKYTVTPREICIQLYDQEYKENRFKGIDQNKYKILESGDEVLEGDVLDITISADAVGDFHVGIYYLNAVSNNKNYVLSFMSSVLKITEAETPFSIVAPVVIIALTLTIVIIVLILSINKYRRYHWKRII